MEKYQYTKEQAIQAAEQIANERLKGMPVLARPALVARMRDELSKELKDGTLYDAAALASLANEKLKPMGMVVTAAEIDATKTGTVAAPVTAPEVPVVAAVVGTTGGATAATNNTATATSSSGNTDAANTGGGDNSGSTSSEEAGRQRAAAAEQAAAESQGPTGWFTSFLQTLVFLVGGLAGYTKDAYKSSSEFVEQTRDPNSKNIDGLMAGTWNGIGNLFTRGYAMMGSMLFGQEPSNMSAPREKEVVTIGADELSTRRNPELDEFNRALNARSKAMGEPEIGALPSPSTPSVPGQQVARSESMAQLPSRRS